MNLEELSKEEIIIPKKFLKDELNSSLWDKYKDNYVIKAEVRKKLLEIADKFYEFLEIETKYEDVYFVGSMASYNWTAKSDIDLHLVIDYKKVNKNFDLVKKYFQIKKNYWNESHNIKIYDIDVELGCQDKDETLHSKAVFSLLNNKWLSKPDKDKFKIDKESLKDKILKISNKIEDLEKIKDSKIVSEKAGKVKESIKNMRKSGLEKGGEFSIENLTFKYLRNNGYILKLIKIKRNADDKNLSLKNEKKQ